MQSKKKSRKDGQKKKIDICSSLLISIFFALPSFGQTQAALDKFFWESLSIKDVGMQMNTDTMSYDGYLLFLNRIHESDQKYRRILKNLNETKDIEKSESVSKLMKLNDKKNQAALLTLLKKFGWPCSKVWDYSLYAWSVVWHAEIIDRSQFLEYLKSGYKNKCLKKGHYESMIK